ncbi:ribosomal L7Ae/L30e/S12e/Gadd45 family protein [Candidatus Woesearchaeota archaeon]|nr:ribosomal L7Ae/L30e/S12e/Gadd45 family protein [Candidatus Woesearchaeota archaeon]
MAVAELRKLVGTPRLVLGTARTIKALRLGKLEKVFLSENVPAGVKEDIVHYAKLAKAIVEQLNVPNEDLGAMCKKPFFVSVVGVLKAK